MGFDARVWSCPRSDISMNLEKILGDLVEINKARLFPEDSSVEIRGVALGPPRYLNNDRFHRILSVNYSTDGQANAKAIWLKFRPGLDRLFPVLDAYRRQLDGRVFPTYYFGWHSDDESVSLLASEVIRGVSLRDTLLRSAVLRQTRRLEPIFHSNGISMRAFHDAFPASDWVYAHEVAATVGVAIRDTPYLSPAEKVAVLRHVEDAAARLSILRLPAVRNHNDWILRNILVTRCGTDILIDSDSMRYRPNWRWYDVAFLMLNVEGACKWAPLLTVRTLSRLWHAFWRGYVGANGLPDGLPTEKLPAIFIWCGSIGCSTAWYGSPISRCSSGG